MDPNRRYCVKSHRNHAQTYRPIRAKGEARRRKEIGYGLCRCIRCGLFHCTHGADVRSICKRCYSEVCEEFSGKSKTMESTGIRSSRGGWTGCDVRLV